MNAVVVHVDRRLSYFPSCFLFIFPVFLVSFFVCEVLNIFQMQMHLESLTVLLY